jgi:hypothetical protein
MRTATGSALVCIGFALGAVGATVSGTGGRHTAIVFLHEREAPHQAVARPGRSAPISPAVNRRPVSAAVPMALTSRRDALVAVAAAAPAAPAPDGRPAAGQDIPQKSWPDAAGTTGLAVSLDPARYIDAATAAPGTAAVNLYRILAVLRGAPDGH